MALINCKQCGHSISDKSRKCPKCGTPTIKEEVYVVKETPINNEVSIPEFTPKKKNDKRIIVIRILVVLILILGIIYFGTTFTTSTSNTSSTEISSSTPIATTNESVSQETTEPINLLTDEKLTDLFLRLWRTYGVDREFVPYRNIEGYKIVKGDLNGDGWMDAVINVYATATPNEKANKDYEVKSFIFCFLNNGSNYELASVTKFPSIYFVTNINSMVIYSNCYNNKSGEFIDHNYKLEGDKLVEVIEEDTEVQYEDSERQYGEEEADIQIDTEAQFPGGKDAMYKFLGEKIKYPTIAQENKIEGTVTVQFVVNENGTLSNFEVIKSVGTYADENENIDTADNLLRTEALRLAKLLPNFIPATHNGSPIKSNYTIRIKFSLSQ